MQRQKYLLAIRQGQGWPAHTTSFDGFMRGLFTRFLRPKIKPQNETKLEAKKQIT
jgi:hypothetical protein